MNRQNSMTLWTLLYNHNPFYLLSTLAGLFAIRMAAGANLVSADQYATLLTISLCGFAVVLAGIGLLVIRCGGVWEDARSIFLAILLVFFGIAVSLDRLCLEQPGQALICLAAAFGLLVVLTELILALLKVRFPAAYRCPYYLSLALMMFWSLLFSPLALGVTGTTSIWLIGGYSLLLAGCILLLVPAVWLGRTHMGNNGTPWSWPWYPWSVIAIVLLAVTLRGGWLGLSFVPAAQGSGLPGAWFLVPILLAIGCVLLHAATRARRPDCQAAVLWLVTIGSGFASLHGSDDYLSRQFVSQLTEQFGSPLWLTVVALTVFYAHAWSLGAAGARRWLLAVLLFAGFVPVTATGPGDLGPVAVWPLIAAFILMLVEAIRTRSTMAMAASLLPASGAIAIWLDSWLPGPHAWFWASQILLVGVGVLAAARHDVDAWRLRIAMAIWLPINAAVTLFAAFNADQGLLLAAGYSLGLASACAVITWQSRLRVFAMSALSCLVVAAAGTVYQVAGSGGLVTAIRDWPANLQLSFAAALLCLGTGVAISICKAGGARRLNRYWQMSWLQLLKPMRAACRPTAQPAKRLEPM